MTNYQKDRRKTSVLVRASWSIYKADRMAYKLSGGEQQRVVIARTLVNEPAVVLADKPTGNFDSENLAKLIDLFNMINHEKRQTFILITHNQGFAQSANRIIYIKDGILLDDDRSKNHIT